MQSERGMSTYGGVHQNARADEGSEPVVCLAESEDIGQAVP